MSTPTRVIFAPPRSSSASKAAQLKQRLFEAQTAQTTRASSQRKLRRYENDHVLPETNAMMQRLAQGDDSLDFDESATSPGGPALDIRSAFRELFLDKNADKLELFRRCEERLAQTSASSRRVRATESLDESAAAWAQMERRMRTVARKVVLNQPEMRAYVIALESLVSAFSESEGCIPDMDTVPEWGPLVEALEGSLTSSQASSRLRTLTVPLRDNSFLRLLLHAVASFFRIKSKTVKTKGSSSGSDKKSMVLTFPAKVSPTLASRASMVAFILKPGVGSVDDE